MFDANYFDDDFYQCKSKTKGGHRRDQNHDVYQWYSKRLRDAFYDTPEAAYTRLSLLDIGAGIGIRTANHIANGFYACPCDISQYGYDNSVLKERHYKADVRDLSVIDRQFDIVNADRVLGYLPPADSFKALKEIDSKSNNYIVLSIICTDHIDPLIPQIAKPGRPNIQPMAYWNEIFKQFPNWSMDLNKTEAMLINGWSCIVVIRKDGQGEYPARFIR